MRKTLLIAAAALAAAVISSQAQVYSLNVVGYYNLVMPSSGYNMVSVQFQVGSSNGASEILPNIPDGTETVGWDQAHAKFVINYYDTGSGSSAPAASWYMSDYATPTNQPVFPVGTSLFVIPGSQNGPVTCTNTVVGTVVGQTNSLQAGYNMAASALPLGGSPTNTLFNMNGFNDGTEFVQWSFGGQTYVINYYDTGAGSTSPAASWYMSDYATPTNSPTFSVGQGMFIIPGGNSGTIPMVYTQTYTNQ
jgi:hypothetical protein